MTTHRLTTASSIWTIDEDAQMITRIPRTEDPRHDTLDYAEVGKPQAYETFEVASTWNYGEELKFARITFPDDTPTVRTGWIEKEEVI